MPGRLCVTLIFGVGVYYYFSCRFLLAGPGCSALYVLEVLCLFRARGECLKYRSSRSRVTFWVYFLLP